MAELATAPATVEQLLAFKPGDFIELDLDPAIQAKVDGVPVFDCHYGTANGRYAIKIDRLIASSTRAGWEPRIHRCPLTAAGPTPAKKTRWPPNGPPRCEQSKPEPASEVADGRRAGGAGRRSPTSPPARPARAGAGNDLNMILDIPVQLTVELGRTRIPIKHILQLAQGSVVELEALAGEPMDVLVNGYLIAQGEVVVVNDKFGIRLTDIVTPSERMRRLSKG